jgi:hypothetical protein
MLLQHRLGVVFDLDAMGGVRPPPLDVAESRHFIKAQIIQYPTIPRPMVAHQIKCT